MEDFDPSPILRVRSLDRYLASLYLPESCRHDIMVLHAFDAEIAAIPAKVSEPLPGEVRLQWWRDQLASGVSVGDHDKAASPLANALKGVISRHDLPVKPFTDLLDARIFDLYQDPMPDTGTFEGYLGETRSAIFNLAARCTGEPFSPGLADLAGHAGMAIGIGELLSGLAHARATGRIYFPMDMISKYGLNRQSWLEEEPDERHSKVMAELIQTASDHLGAAKKLLSELAPENRVVYLSLALVDPILSRSARAGKSLDRPIRLKPLHIQFLLFKAAITGRY